MYYALSLFNSVRLYKHCDLRTGHVFFHDGFLLSSTPSSSEQYTILFVKMHPTVAPSLLFITSLTSFTMVVQQLLALHRSRWDTQGGQAKRRIIAVSATLFTFLLATLAGILGLVASHAQRVGDHSREARATVSGKIVVIALQFGRKCVYYPLRIKFSPVLPSLCILAFYPKSESSSRARAYTLTMHRDRHLGKREGSHGSSILPPRCKFVNCPSTRVA